MLVPTAAKLILAPFKGSFKQNLANGVEGLFSSLSLAISN